MQIKDKKGNLWEGITVEEASARGIKGIDIIGDVLTSRKDNVLGKISRITSDGSEISLDIYPYKEKTSFTEKVIGYIPYEDSVENEKYVRAVRKSFVKPLVIALIIVALLAAGFGLYSYFSGPKLDKAAVAYEMPGGMKNTDPSQLMIPYLAEIGITDRQGETLLPNPEGNQSYFKYSIVLDDNNKTIYQSDLVEPGKAILDWQITEDLSPGDYKATVKIETFSVDDPEQETNGSQVKSVLHVK